MAEKKKTIIPPSLQPRKSIKKAIPNAPVIQKREKKVKETPPKAILKPKKVEKEEKDRFTLWLNKSVYNAFKIHIATRKGSGSDYIESLIKKDLNLK